MAILQINNLSMIYQTEQAETKAIENVSFSVEKGQFVSIVGPSGCGKSTLLSCIAGLTLPADGEILLNGKEIDGISREIGYMLQTDNLLPWRSVYKNVLLGLEIQNNIKSETVAYAAELLKKYGLWEFKDSFPRNLSGGMRQRAALIRTLATRPEILLLDEAFSALDYQTRLTVSCDVWQILRREGKTMVMVTHDIPEAVAMSDKIVILSSRPAIVKKILMPEFGDKNPTRRRESPMFSRYFNEVWREMTP